MYEVIVLGATFAAAGIAQQCGEQCLIIEASTRAGYEFFGALHFGVACEVPPKTATARQLHQCLSGDNIYGGDRYIYPYFKSGHIRFGTQLVSVTQKGDRFVCLTHGVNGFVSYEAKKVVDTRSSEAISRSKTYNILIESHISPSFPGVSCERAGMPEHYVVRCPVSLSCSYPEARQAAMAVIEKFSPLQRLILSADVFDYHIKEDLPKQENSVYLLPSKAYRNPALAFEAGFLWGGGSK